MPFLISPKPDFIAIKFIRFFERRILGGDVAIYR
jgi:hypothetical protein